MNEPAVVNYAAEKYSVELRDIPVPQPEPDQVLLEVQAVGVCGSDLHMWAEVPSWPVKYPVVLGHEFSGVVREVGPGVSGFSPGDRVVSETHAEFDAHSPLARRGLYNLDPTRRGFGAMVDGAMRRHVAVPARILHHVPDELSLEKAALTEPCCVAYNAVAVNSEIRPGDRILVLGPGTIGLLCAAMAKLCGAQVAVAGLPADQDRLGVARRYGCIPIEGDPAEWAQAGGTFGVDGVIDATGVSASLKTALDMVQPAGWITKVGWGPQPLDYSLDPLVQKNVRLQGSFSHYWPIWEKVIRLLSSNQLDTDPILGGLWPLGQWREAFEAMHSGRIVKAILKPEF